MARSFVTLVAVALPICVVGSSGGDATLLVQTQPAPAEMAEGQVKTIEKEAASDNEEDSVVSSLLTKPESVFKAMTEEVSSLENEIEKVRKQGQTSLASQQATFEAKLEEQRNGNAELEHNLEGVNEEISKLTTTNRQLWQRGKDLQKENDQQRQELREMRARIADAAEFVDLQIKELADANAPEEKVIGELDALEGEQMEETHHKDSMSRIASFGKGKAAAQDENAAAMLSVEEQREGRNIDEPVSILKAMENTAASLEAEQKASETKLKDIFKKKFEAEAATHARLTSELSVATQKRATLSSVFTRLTDAVKHLEDVRDGLKQGILSLGMFSEKVGKEHVEKYAAGEKKVSLSEEGPSTFHRGHGHGGDEKGKGWLSWAVR